MSYVLEDWENSEGEASKQTFALKLRTWNVILQDLKSMGHREISHLPASYGSPISQYSLVSASCLPLLNWNISETWVWSQGKGDETVALPRKCEKDIAGHIYLKSLGRQLEGKGKACALATVTSDRNAACQEHSIARGKHLHGRVVCCSCRQCHLAHIWLTQLDHFAQVFYFSAWHNTGKPHTTTETTLPCSPVELADEGTLYTQHMQAPSPPSA